MNEQVGPAHMSIQVQPEEDPTGLLRMLVTDDNIVGMRMTANGGFEIELYEADARERPELFHGVPIEYVVQENLSQEPAKARQRLADFLADDDRVLDVNALPEGILQVTLRAADDRLRPAKMHGMPVHYRVVA